MATANATETTYDLTFKDMLYIWFGKKACPKCGGKMIKENRVASQSKENGNLNTLTKFSSMPPEEIRENNILYSNTDVTFKEIAVYFKCSKCGQEYSVKELSTKSN